MNEDRITESPSWNDPRGQVMKTPDDVAEMLRLKACGWDEAEDKQLPPPLGLSRPSGVSRPHAEEAAKQPSRSMGPPHPSRRGPADRSSG